LESLVERIAKAEITRCLLNTTWLVTMARKNVPKDMGNDKLLGESEKGNVKSRQIFLDIEE